MHKISVISNSSLSQLSFGISFILKNFILKNWKFQCLMWNCPHSEVFPSCIVLTVSLDLTLAVLILGMESLLYLEFWCKVTSWFGLTSWCQIKNKFDDQAMAALIYNIFLLLTIFSLLPLSFPPPKFMKWQWCWVLTNGNFLYLSKKEISIIKFLGHFLSCK